ncbi:C39 family peptidase [Lactiplantibacillus modestisalitolerans]|uniref:C39 family peptidase n=2 Tax=Lactiplantibacillus modestisalitolerans TaxID=1457219 RepID=A0ABV5WQQ9_9LACO
MAKHYQRSLRGRVRLTVVTLITTLLILMGLTTIQNHHWIDSTLTWFQQIGKKPQVKVNRVMLNVPLINQMTPPTLYNGCEITSLTMIMHYYGINVSKNTLANRLTSVPLTYDNGQHGNPNVGFVGDVTGADPGLGVYHGPIKRVAKTETKHVKDLTGASFNQVIKQLEAGRPVWTVTTTSFAPVNSMETWDTPQGKVKITYDVHSVVIVGFNRQQQKIYINNPYGKKQQAVDWQNFAAAYKQLGQQAVVLTLKHH